MNKPPTICPVCSSESIEIWNQAKDFEYYSSIETYNYYTCQDCMTIFLDPAPYDKLKEIYPSNYYSFIGSSRNIISNIKEWLDQRFLKNILKEINSKEISVLDIGGGTGWILDVIKKTDRRVSFTQIVDIDEHAKTIAEENGHSYYTGTVEDFKTEKKFNLILMLNLIEHVKSPKEILLKAASLLAADGIILIKTPNTDSLDARIFRKSYWGGLHCPRHWVIFSDKSFQMLTKSSGLQIKKLEFTQGAPFWAFSIIAALSRKKLIQTSANNPIIFHKLFAPISALFAIIDFIRRPFCKTSQMFIQLIRK